MAEARVSSGAQDLITAEELQIAEDLLSCSADGCDGAQADARELTDRLLAALQQARLEREEARHACANWQREAQAEYAKRKEVEAQLAAQDAALQGLEERWREHADDLGIPRSETSIAAIGWLRQCANQLASVRAARPKET